MSHQSSEECENLHYDPRLKILGLMRLGKHIRSDLIETFKILNGDFSVDTD